MPREADTLQRVCWLHVLAILVASALIASTVLNQRNTLHLNGRWESGKVALARGVMGAAATMVTRVPLQRNRLNLHAWFGFHEFTFTDGREIREIEFRFRPVDGGYLDVLLGSNGDTRFGIRLASDPRFASLRYRLSRQGEFVSREGLPEGELLQVGAWNHVYIAVTDPGSFSISINGSPARPLGPGGEASEQLTFRGGLGRALLDDIVVSFVDEGHDFTESFSNRRGAIGIFALVTAALGVISGLAYLVLLGLGGRSSRRAHLTIATAELLLVLGAGLFCAIDFFVVAARYVPGEGQVDFGDYVNNIKREAELVPRLRRLGTTLRDDGCRRIMLVGSSQTWGAGARTEEESVERFLGRALNLTDSAECYTIINVGIPAIGSTKLLAHYRDDWLAMAPEVMVINLSNNDRNGPSFRNSLEQFIAMNRANNVQTLFVLEANSPEAAQYGQRRTPLERNHVLMRSVAEANGVPLLDMNAYLTSRWGDGFLWWDFVHLTSFGQRLFAERLALSMQTMWADREAGA